MTPKYLTTLEFDKIRAMAAQEITCPEAREMLLEEMPCETPADERAALAQTDCIASLLLKNGSPRISGIEGVRNTVQRAAKGGVLSMAELLNVGHMLRDFAALHSWYGETEHDALPVDDLFYMLTPRPTLEKTIFDDIISENEMADTASDGLYDVRRKIRAAENSIRDKLDGIVKSQVAGKILQEAVVSIRNGRFVVPVKAEYRGEMGGVIHDVSSTGSTLFVEPTAVVEANAKIMQLRSQEQAEIERILAALSAQVAADEELFLLSYDAMLHIDVLLAKAQLSLRQDGMMPTVRDDYAFSLVRARHPLIAKEQAVPIDLTLGKDYDTLVVTGPNTGGKTVSLKTAGLLCAMAQHGYLIPAYESSEVCTFRDILADIGDEQSIEQSLSTFSGHIKNITEILTQVGPDTLVLIDELGAGTDPAEGAALAVAVIEQLRKSGTRIMATTHYSELKVFALDTPGVQNASCEFDVKTLRPTYRISVGVPGKSNAFLISERLGLSAAVIEAAREHLSGEERQFDRMLEQLEDLKLELKESKEKIERLQHAAESELAKAQEKREELIRQGEAELAAARQKANAVAQEVQNEAYALMDEMRRLEKDSKQAAAQRAIRAREIARRDSEKLFGKADVVHSAPQVFTPLKDVRPGQEVYVTTLDKVAVAQSAPDKKGMVEVRAGVIRTKVPLSALAAPQKQQEVQPKQGRYTPRQNRSDGDVRAQATRNASMEINLLGMNVEEALHEVDKFIDNGLMSGQSTLYIIHGKGAGILRKAVQEHLRTHPNVKSYRLGAYGEGEAGVTVAELK